jgi:hypothetical protein
MIIPALFCINQVNLSTSLHRLAKLSVMTPLSDRMLRQALRPGTAVLVVIAGKIWEESV